MDLRRVIHRDHVDTRRHLAHIPDGVARKAQLIADHQDVRRLQLSLDQVPVVQECEGIEDRQQQLAGLVLRQCTVAQQLRQRLVGVLHHQVQVRLAIELTPTCLQKANQVGMFELRGRFPLQPI